MRLTKFELQLNCSSEIDRMEVFTIYCSKQNKDDHKLITPNDRNFKMFTKWTECFLSSKMQKMSQFQL